jgi:hypothetical protein
MKLSKEEWFMYPFGISCVATSMSLCLYWCYKFSLNEDLSVVQYKNFYETNDDVFPTMSLCLGNPFLEERLSKYGINITSYVDFLGGKLFAKEMLNIDYNHVTIDIVNYIKAYRLYFRNNSNIKYESGLTVEEKTMLTFVSYNGFIYGNIFYKCFALQIPKYKDLEIFRILLSNKIFPNGVRPTYYSLKTFVHLPKQFMLSMYTQGWNWPYRSKHERYKMRLVLNAIEIVRRRNKKEQPCNENWKDYDDWVINRFRNKNKCNAPYYEQEKNFSTCSTQQLTKLYLLPRPRAITAKQEYITPCKTLDNVRIDYVESNMENAAEDSVGEFWFSIGFPLYKFKEIDEVRYYKCCSLIQEVFFFYSAYSINGNNIFNDLLVFTGPSTSIH